MKKIFYRLKEVFLPRNLTCSYCGRESFTGRILCEKCLEKLEPNNEYVCDHCGDKTEIPTTFCDRCKGRLLSFDRARSVYVYGEVSGTLIRKLKYDGEKYLAEEFAKKLYELYIFSVTYADGIVYVPVTDKKLKRRGYNQSELLAENLSKLSGVPLLNVLEKTKETESQVGKSRSDRQKNLDGSFAVTDRKAVKDKRLVLVDDVMTTGTTANLIAEKLKKAGAEEVFVLTVATANNRRKSETPEQI